MTRKVSGVLKDDSLLSNFAVDRGVFAVCGCVSSDINEYRGDLTALKLISIAAMWKEGFIKLIGCN